jgi:hypothetical protein
MRRSRKRIEPEAVLSAIAAIADDGFAPRHALGPRFPRHGERDLVKTSQRLARSGLLLERRGPDGGIYLALTGEGWRELGQR